MPKAKKKYPHTPVFGFGYVFDYHISFHVKRGKVPIKKWNKIFDEDELLNAAFDDGVSLECLREVKERLRKYYPNCEIEVSDDY